jgi:uncharacterized membrane protein
MMMHALYTLSVIVHVLAACAWIGAMIFFVAVVVPILRRKEYSAIRPGLVRFVGRRFGKLGWTSLAVLLVTGVSNLGLRGIGLSTLESPSFWQADAGRALACKLTFVALVLASTIAHDALAGRSRHLAAWLGRATLLFSLIVVAFAVWLVRGLP